MDPPALRSAELGSPQESLPLPRDASEEVMDGEDPMLDLEQLEELHDEAERMKALGNKHMAAQEYTRAYNAYSAALQLSPVGPSSHVFLSNRSAALLSLKRYSAAATDARRAIALAPTFGKAHARLGQSLYFLKDYEGAVSAYEDAIHYEPDNPITKTYLEKARTKWERQKEKALKHRSGGEEVSVLTAESSVQQTVANSVATDPNASAAVVKTGFRGQSKAIMRAVGGSMNNAGSTPNSNRKTDGPLSSTPTLNENAPLDESGEYDDDEDYPDDPDFDEALRIQERANRYLANKNYKYAIEEYTAALFLVPDDINLSPELHLGRAHALNGSRRHESAKIDSQLALKIKRTPEAYSTLAKSLFYMKDYEGAIIAFDECKELLPAGEQLSMFDRAYLRKAEAAMVDISKEMSSGHSVASAKTISRLGSSAPIPKLKPPKFVSREEALTRTPNMPAMPKRWPKQSPRESRLIKYYGEEREIEFLSEALGIKLNRGPDGVVRVIEVSPDVPGSPIARNGTIEVGDVIREAAGVDIRRPITNIMWGDTVALIKMAPRPIVLIVAKETTESIMDERKRAAHNALSPTSAEHYFPSNASTEESVREQMERQENEHEQNTQVSAQVTQQNSAEETEPALSPEIVEDDAVVETENCEHEESKENTTEQQTQKSLIDEDEKGDEEPVDENVCEEAKENQIQAEATKEEEAECEKKATPIDNLEEELEVLGADIFFENNENLVTAYNGWDNLRWMSYAGVRKICTATPVYRYFEGRTGFLWNKDEYVQRKLAIYEEPNLILVLREASCLAELRDLTELPPDAVLDEETALASHLFVESVIDPNTTKLRLSPLTTATSIIPSMSKDCTRLRSTFELINPTESIILSAVRQRKDGEKPSYDDSRAFFETTEVEFVLTKSICSAQEPDTVDLDFSWIHQIILGTLHSYVILGNQKHLDMGIQQALRSKNGQSHLDLAIQQASEKMNPRFLNPRIIDAIDEGKKTALQYACESRFSSAVISLVKAGADVNTRIQTRNMTLCHVSAKKLDFKSLDAMLAVSRLANEGDELYRSPMYLAITEGRTVGGQLNPHALERCIATLAKFGGEVGELMENRHPVSYLAYMCQAEEMTIVLKYSQYKFPLHTTKAEEIGISVSALYQYPIHSALISLIHRIQNLTLGGCADSQQLWRDCEGVDVEVNKTLKALFSCGFEPNERIEGLSKGFREMEELLEYVGFAPTQILMASVIELEDQRNALGEDLYAKINDILANVMECLTLHGGRIFPDTAPLVRSEERKKFVEESDTDSKNKSTKRSRVKIQGNIELSLLVGRSKIVEGQSYWKAIKPAPIPSNVALHTDKARIENSLAPGGSDEKSCSICWKKFGMLTRKHRCRISRRFLCDECSSHRICVNGEEHRISDGQFLLAKAQELRELSKKSSAVLVQERQRERATKLQGVASRLDQLEANEKANRDSLFGGIMASVTKSLGGTEDTAESGAASLSGLSNQLNQTRDALNQRGDKLATLSDKSDKLVNASQDFAAMAKELNRKSSQSFFSGW
eukprot:jgi/Psemu1/255215/estExt_Genewise1Plus.C_1300023